MRLGQLPRTCTELSVRSGVPAFVYIFYCKMLLLWNAYVYCNVLRDVFVCPHHIAKGQSRMMYVYHVNRLVAGDSRSVTLPMSLV